MPATTRPRYISQRRPRPQGHCDTQLCIPLIMFCYNYVFYCTISLISYADRIHVKRPLSQFHDHVQ